MKRKIWVILTVLSLAVTMTPMMGMNTYGEEVDSGESNPALVLGTEILRDTSNTESTHSVYMAEKAWQVIGYGDSTEGKKQVASNSATMTLISPGILKANVVFDLNGGQDYGGSNLQGQVNNVAATFTNGEKCAIAPRILTAGEYAGINSDGISGEEVKNALLWPLSGKEAYAMDESLRVLAPDSTILDENSWWLRSQFVYFNFGTVIKGDGVWYSALATNGYGLRPAFNLSLRSVSFLSAVQNGKDSGEPGADALKAVETNPGREWKLTLIDDGTTIAGLNGHANFTAARSDSGDVAPGGTVKLSYSGAKEGENEYVSVVLRDVKGKILYYGHLAASSEHASEAPLNIPSDIPSGTYVLSVFAEQCNGTNKTDYASKLSDITIKVAAPHVHTALPTYTWSKDNSRVTAKRICDDDASHVETETVDTTAQIIKPATCESTGITTYTSMPFENKAFTIQTKTVEDIDPLGHDYRYTGMTWSADLSAAKANIVCKNDSSHTKTIDAKVESVTVDSTCQHNGITVYTAAVVYDGVTCTETRTAGINPKKHKWDAGIVTTPATADHQGVKTYTCKVCGVTKTEVIKKTGLKKGDSAAAADKTITSMKKDGDIPGSAFSPLQLKSIRQGKKAVMLRWEKVTGAKKYALYGNACGKKNKMKKLAVVTGNSKSISKIAGRKLKKGTYYKFIVVALDKNNTVVSSSKTIHVATKGGKVGNHRQVIVKVRTDNKTRVVEKTMKKGSSLKLKTELISASKNLKIKKHAGVRYESSRTKVAAVSKEGVIRAKGKGSCVIYAYAQNGVAGKVKVIVK